MKAHIIKYKNKNWFGFESFPFDKSDVQVVIVFAERKLLENNTIYTKLHNEFPNANIIMSSTAGEISAVDIDENTAICTCINFKQTPVAFSVDNIAKYKDSFLLGKALVQKIPKDNLAYLFVLSDGNLINGDELVKGLHSTIAPNVVVTGGLAGDADRFKKTMVGINEDVKIGNVALMGLYGKNIKVGTAFKGGWDMFGPEKIITKSVGNVLYDIDNECALDLYKKYLGKYADSLPSSALLFPISMKSADNELSIVRTILSIDEKNKTMTFAGSIPEGSRIRLMKSNFDRLVYAASEAGEEAVQSLGKNIKADVAIIISCIGRKIILADRAEEEVHAAIEHFSPDTTVAGFFSYGEVAPYKHTNTSFLHNQTITITTFAEVAH